MTACGPLQSFACNVACAEATGYPPLLVSPEPGCARLSSFTSLWRAPSVLGNHHRWHARTENQCGIGAGRWGILRSEVKEEGRPKAGPGDTSTAECPAGTITRQRRRANDRKGPQAVIIWRRTAWVERSVMAALR